MSILKTTSYSSAVTVLVNQALQEKGVAQKQVAEALDVTISSASRLLRGRIALSIEDLHKLCTMAEVSPVDILKEADSKLKYLTQNGWSIADRRDPQNDYLLVVLENRKIFSRYIQANDVFELANLVSL